MHPVRPHQVYGILSDQFVSARTIEFRVTAIEDGLARGIVLGTGREATYTVKALATNARGIRLLKDEHGNNVPPEQTKYAYRRRIDGRMREAFRLHREAGYSKQRLARYFSVTEGTVGIWLKRVENEKGSA